MKTFQEWSRLGYKIIKGSKAHWINDIPMFDAKQVIKYSKTYANHWKACTPYDGPADHWGSMSAIDFDNYCDL